MDILSSKYGAKIKGTLEGFDRIIFKGILKPLCYTAGMQIFLYRNKILNKDYKAWISKSAAIIADAGEYTKQHVLRFDFTMNDPVRKSPVWLALRLDFLVFYLRLASVRYY